MKVAAAIAAQPDGGLPQQCGDWGPTQGAYRLLNNERVTAQALMQPHIHQTRQTCAALQLVLSIQDSTYVDYGHHPAKRGLAPLYGSDLHHGMIQHSALALTDEGRLIGLLHSRCCNRAQTPEGETRRQRRQRWSESDLWPQTVEAVGQIGPRTRVIHVADAEADDFKFLQACAVQGQGFVTRSQHNRSIHDGAGRLWSFMADQPVRCGTWIDLPARAAVTVGPKSKHQPARSARRARVEVRWASLTLDPPANDPRYRQRLAVQAVSMREVNAPEGVEPFDGVLLTSEPVTCVAEALTVMRWYRYRWLQEEWHRAQKEGCRLEQSQLREAAALQRLAALTAIVAVRLIQLRDLADDPATADSPPALQQALPWLWIALVAAKTRSADAASLTPRQFWRTVARLGGHLGRQGDGRPGWRSIWRGYRQLELWTHGAALASRLPPPPPPRDAHRDEEAQRCV